MIENTLVEQMSLLLVVALPISIILAKQISKIFAKHDPALEKTTTILTDVIGILTKKELQMKALYFNDYKAYIKEKSPTLETENLKTKINSKMEMSSLMQDQTVQYASIASHLCHYKKMSQIESTMNIFFTRCGLNKSRVLTEYEKIQDLPSDDFKKVSTTVVIHNQTNEIFSFSKGNPKSLLQRCTRILIDGVKKDITYNMRLQLKKRLKRINQHGQKAIAFAYKGLPLKRLNNYTEDFAGNDLVFLGIITLANPVNIEIKNHIELAKKLGIKPYIISTTQERKTVAAAIELGIINPHYFESINSDYLKDVNDQKLSKMLENKEKDYVFSELIPSDRDRIINALRYSGQNIVIIRPDLKMTFQKITQAIIKGRTEKENEPKLILHSFSCKIAELFIIIMTILLRTPIPFSVTLILFIEIFINLPLEMAIKSNKPETDIMDKNYTHPTITIPFKQLLSNGILIGAIICGIYLFNILRYGWVMGETTPLSEEAALKSTTIAFVLLVISQIFNAFNVKNLDTSIFKIKTFTNRYLIATTVIVVLLTYIFINFFILGNYLDIGIISGIEWQIILFATVVLVLAEEIKKFIIRKFTKNANTNPKK